MSRNDSRAERRRSGRALVSVLVVLVLLAAAGGANYYRNWQSEQEEQRNRPFQGYTAQHLEELATAYRSELQAWNERYAAANAQRFTPKQTGTMQGNVEEFDKAVASSSRLRQLNTEVAIREARLRDIGNEQAYRAASEGVSLHVRRLTSL